MTVEDYIPVECIRDARDFVDQMNCEVNIVTRMKLMNMIESTPEADAFIAWWNQGLYGNHPHSLIVLYEQDKPITDAYGEYDAQNAKDFVLYRMECFYEVLLNCAMIEEVKDESPEE